ncbi:MAG: hypothetical protein ACI8WT_000025 [Clostridium sp.]|jgi:hypothetical protein
MFTGTVKLCRQSSFKFEYFYRLIDGYKDKADLTLFTLKGDGNTITYDFTNEDNRVWLEFDSHQEFLIIKLSVSCALEDFTFFFKELEAQARLFYD